MGEHLEGCFKKLMSCFKTFNAVNFKSFQMTVEGMRIKKQWKQNGFDNRKKKEKLRGRGMDRSSKSEIEQSIQQSQEVYFFGKLIIAYFAYSRFSDSKQWISHSRKSVLTSWRRF